MNEAIHARAVDIAFMLLLATSMWLWLTALDRWRKGQPLIAPGDVFQVSPWGLSDVAVAYCLQVFHISLIFYVAKSYTGVDLSKPSNGSDADSRALVILAIGLGNIFSSLLTLTWLFFRHDIRAKDLGLRWEYLKSDVQTGVASFLMLAPVVYGIQSVLQRLWKSQHPLIELLTGKPTFQFFLISGFVAVLAAPLTEEFFYRLLLQGWLERLSLGVDGPWSRFFGGRFETIRRVDEPLENEDVAGNAAAGDSHDHSSLLAKRWPILVSSLIFAVQHSGTDRIPIFVLALAFGYLFQQTHRIIPSMVAHICLNGCTLMMLWWVTHQAGQ